MKKVKIAVPDWMPGDEFQKEYLYHILCKRFEFEFSENPDFVIYSGYNREYLKYQCIRIFYTPENLRPNFRECDYAFGFDYLENPRYLRLPYFRIKENYKQLFMNKEVEHIFKLKTHFCNFVYSNKILFRDRFFKKLSLYKHIDAPGDAMNNMSSIGSHESAISSRYQPLWEIEKINFLKKYKFTIAFENSSYPGYATEKILHAMVANTIAIYWGDPLISRQFNPKSFINCHDYPNWDSVIQKIIELNQNNDLYKDYLSQPYFYDNKEPEDLKEEKILDQFEIIFLKQKSYVHKIYFIDSLKSYGYKIRLKLKLKWQNFAILIKKMLKISAYKYFR